MCRVWLWGCGAACAACLGWTQLAAWTDPSPREHLLTALAAPLLGSYGAAVLALELLGFTAVLPYALLNVHGHYPKKPGSRGLPTANSINRDGAQYK
jgi:hypothetical protein